MTSIETQDTPPPAEPRSKSFNLLLIEDDLEQQKLLKNVLANLDYELRIAGSGEEGLEILEDFRPDLILLDLTLPEMDGFEFLMLLRGSEGTVDVPIIVISAADDHENMIRAYALGATDYIAKPLNHGILVMKLGNLIALNRMKNSYKSAVEELKGQKAKLERNVKFISRYFSKDFIEALLSGDVSGELGGKVVEATILFVDLRNSTGIAENLNADEFATMISEIFTDIMDLIFATGGSVNKLLGDGILATYGCPFPSPEDALNAIKTASKIRQYFDAYNEIKQHETRVMAGMGIATGHVFAGNIGSVNRMEYSVMGDPVNLAARLEALTKAAGLDVLLDGNTRQKIGNQARFKKVNFTKIRGKANQVKIYYLSHESVF